jgi:peptidoglycan glycosyltransferase
VNRPIRVLAVVCGVMFLALLLNVNYVQFLQASELNARDGNRRVIDEEFSRERGPILVAGRPAAQSVPSDDDYDFQREYPSPRLYFNLTGYYSYEFGAEDLENTQNSILSGSDPRLFVNRVVDLLGSRQPSGGSIALTIDPAAQQAALNGLSALGDDVQGAVVALEPSTGAILAMVSRPSYDPNRLATHDLQAARKARLQLLEAPGDPLLDRSRENTYAPGSTFKVVTAAAALSSGQYAPDTLVKGGPVLDLPQTTDDLTNDTDCPSQVTLTTALALSCNVSFGEVGLALGDDALREQAEAFGFGDDSYLDELSQVASRFPEDPADPQVAQSAIGQFDVSATPLQMAMVAAGVANDGTVMKPYLVDKVYSPDIELLDDHDPEELHQAVSSGVATQLTQMMVEVVTNGTASSAQIPGVEVAAKTGTAERSEELAPYAWFISFAPADDPEVAVAVFVENPNVPREQISGGGLAGPIAKSVMESVIG